LSVIVRRTEPAPETEPAVKVTMIVPLTEPAEGAVFIDALPPVATKDDERYPPSALNAKERSISEFIYLPYSIRGSEPQEVSIFFLYSPGGCPE
jgi:hypothetical protein